MALSFTVIERSGGHRRDCDIGGCSEFYVKNFPDCYGQPGQVSQSGLQHVFSVRH